MSRLLFVSFFFLSLENSRTPNRCSQASSKGHGGGDVGGGGTTDDDGVAFVGVTAASGHLIRGSQDASGRSDVALRGINASLGVEATEARDGGKSWRREDDNQWRNGRQQTRYFSFLFSFYSHLSHSL